MDGVPDDNFSISSVFSQSFFVVPEYQRDYAWTQSNVSDLLDDTEFVLKQNDTEPSGSKLDHYFGTLVLENRGTVSPNDYEDFSEYGIVDGQQRLTTVTIVISAVIDEMRSLSSEPGIEDGMREKMRERAETIRGDYIEYEGTPRVRLNGLAESVYEEAVVKGKSPDVIREGGDYVETERRVLTAKETVADRLGEWRDTKCDDRAAYYKLLNRVVKVLTQRFEVNVRVVADIDEAARMFKVINNRGRGLKLHDKVRSHLVYCASRSNDLGSEYVYQKFNNIIENVTIHDGFSDDEVDDLVRIHWSVFTSERSDSRAKRGGPSKIHRRLSDVRDYASVQREDFEAFIKPYLTSLERFSEQYPFLTDREMFAERYVGEGRQLNQSEMEETVRKMQLLYMHSTKTAVAPLLMSTADHFGVDSPEFLKLVTALEKLIFGHSLVMSHGTNAYSNAFQSIANDLFWSETDEETINSIFNAKNSRYYGYQSKELGFRTAIDNIRQRTERLAPVDKVIDEFLTEDDVLDGEYSPGWGGIRRNELIVYMMYEYERSLRTDTGLKSLSSYTDFRRDFEVEHLVPKNAERGDRLQDHERNRNRLGNLAVLSSGDNNAESNKPFTEKYQNVYSNSSLQILKRLNGPDFTVEDITDREEEELFPFIRERWG